MYQPVQPEGRPPPYSAAPPATSTTYTYDYGSDERQPLNDYDDNGGTFSSSFSDKAVRAGKIYCASDAEMYGILGLCTLCST